MGVVGLEFAGEAVGDLEGTPSDILLISVPGVGGEAKSL